MKAGGIVRALTGMAVGAITAVVPIGLSYFEPHYSPFISYVVLATIGYEIMYVMNDSNDEGGGLIASALTAPIVGCAILALVWFLAV